MNTLFSGKIITVTHEDSTTEEIKVRQLRLADYERAFLLVEDEMALAAFACDKSKEWLTGKVTSDQSPVISPILPESYEAVRATVVEVNKSFFAWSARKQKMLEEAEDRNAQRMAKLPPEAMKRVMELGSASLNASQTPRPR